MLAQTTSPDTLPVAHALVENKKHIMCGSDTDLNKLRSDLTNKDNKEADIIVDISAEDVQDAILAANGKGNTPLLNVLRTVHEYANEGSVLCHPMGTVDDQKYVVHFLPGILVAKNIRTAGIHVNEPEHRVMLQERYAEAVRISRPHL